MFLYEILFKNIKTQFKSEIYLITNLKKKHKCAYVSVKSLAEIICLFLTS
jgi:hypothetical protein